MVGKKSRPYPRAYFSISWRARSRSGVRFIGRPSPPLAQEVLDRLQDPVAVGDLRGDHALVARELSVEVLLELARAVGAAHLSVAEDVAAREDVLLEQL